MEVMTREEVTVKCDARDKILMIFVPFFMKYIRYPFFAFIEFSFEQLENNLQLQNNISFGLRYLNIPLIFKASKSPRILQKP